MLIFICIFFYCTLYSEFMHVLLIFSRYSLENEDVIRDRNLLYTVAKVILMTDPIEVIHYVNFVINVTWTMMNYSDIYGVTIYSVTSVMLMVSISIIGNVHFCLQVYSSLKNSCPKKTNQFNNELSDQRTEMACCFSPLITACYPSLAFPSTNQGLSLQPRLWKLSPIYK